MEAPFFVRVRAGLDGRFLFLLTVLMELLSSLISFLIGYYALKSYRASSAKGLYLLYLGFIILGIGNFLRAVTSLYFAVILKFVESPASPLLRLLNLAGSIYTITQLIAYSVFTATYIMQAKTIGKSTIAMSTVSAAVFPIYRLFFIPQLELIAIVMLGFVAVHSLNNWLFKKNTDSALVFFGFGFMVLSHLLFLFMILDEILLFLGQASQLAGFACLLAMLAKVSKPNA